MGRIRYQVAVSLDGYIAGPKGESDWIIMDPEIDFSSLFAQFDTFVMGRKTYEAVGAMVSSGSAANTFVFSRTLDPTRHPSVTVVSELSEATLAPVRARAKKDIWLFGGGVLFQSFLDAGLADSVEVAIIPVLLGGGIPFLPQAARRIPLTLKSHRVYKSGIVSLEYAISGRAPNH